MCKEYTVCLCFGKEHCEEVTREIAQNNNATNWFVEPVVAPMSYTPAYRGKIVMEVN